MNERMNKKQLLDLLDTLKINKEEYTILSSSALVLRDIYQDAGDLDIAVTEEGLNQLKQNYQLHYKERGWYDVNDKIECVQNNMEGIREKVGDYYLEDILHYYEYLKTSTREKDKLRIPIVEKYIKEKQLIK